MMRGGSAACCMAIVLSACAAQGPKVVVAPAPNLAPVPDRASVAERKQNVKAGAPKWVTGISIYPDKICAVGTCDPSFIASEGKQCAADDARAALAKTISVNVATVTLEETRDGVQSSEKATVINGAKGWESDVALDESVVQEYWYDRDGVVSPMKGVTYALACISKGSLAGAKNK